MKKKTFAILALLALMFGVLTGCTVDPDQAVPTKYVERVNVTPEAKASVGEQRARQAAKVASDFTLAHGTNPKLLDPQKSHYTADELTKGVEGSLTTGALNSWRNRVNKALAGDEDAVDALDGLQLYSIKEPTWQVPTNGKLIVSQLLTNVEVDAENDTKNVIVTMHHRTVARYETDKSPVEVTFDRDLTYTMAPSADGKTWLISEYTGPYRLDSEALLR